MTESAVRATRWVYQCVSSGWTPMQGRWNNLTTEVLSYVDSLLQKYTTKDLNPYGEEYIRAIIRPLRSELVNNEDIWPKH